MQNLLLSANDFLVQTIRAPKKEESQKSRKLKSIIIFLIPLSMSFLILFLKASVSLSVAREKLNVSIQIFPTSS